MPRDPKSQIVLGAIALLTGLGWCVLLLVAPGHQMFLCGPDGIVPLIPAWSLARAMSVLAMWTVMSWVMMLPSAASEIVGVSATAQRTGIFAASLWFSTGYLAIMAIAGAGGAVAEWVLESLGTDNAPNGGSPLLALVLMAIAGVFALFPFGRHVSSGDSKPSALFLGFRHGVSCLPSCVAMISIQLLGGAANMTWTMALTGLMIAGPIIRQRNRLVAPIAGFVVAKFR